MALPIQLTIDLNEIIKKLASIISDVAHYNQDIRESASIFKQEIGDAEFLVGVASRRLLGSQLGNLQREAIETTFDNIKHSHGELAKLINGDAIPSSTSYSAGGASLSVRSFASPAARRIRWAMGRKSTASKILRDIRQSNDYLRRSLQDLELVGSESPQVPSLPENITDSSQTILSTQRMRLGIRRGRIPPDRDILRHPSFLDKDGGSPLEDGGNIQTAIYSGSYPVLVESSHVGDFDEASERRAMQLAMLLSQPRVAGFNVLKCEGLVYNETSNIYEFIFDRDGVLADLKEDDIPFSRTAELSSNFRSLNFHLLRHPDKSKVRSGSQSLGNGDLANIFRYSKMGIDTRFRPITLLERLVFARSLAQTLSTLHLAEWVHGNITSRNILFFQNLDSGNSHTEDRSAIGMGLSATRLGRPYLFGFQFTRLLDEFSNQHGWNQLAERDNVYRHPERQIKRGRGPEKRHSPLHDIYSLGVIFLEIGLGQTAEDLLRISKRSQQKALGATKSAIVPTHEGALTLGVSSQAVFLQLACQLLPERMGDAFAQATRLCLSGDMQTLSSSQDRDQDALAEPILDHEVTLSVAFWASVVEPLDRLINTMTVI